MDDDQLPSSDALDTEHSRPKLSVVPHLGDTASDHSPIDSDAGFAPNPMAIEFASPSSTASVLEGGDAIDSFDPTHHNDLLDRLEHELALVDAALTHIDDDDLSAAETAIKELARHNDDGQVALKLR